MEAIANTIGFSVGDEVLRAGKVDHTLYPPSGRHDSSFKQETDVWVPESVVCMTTLNSTTLDGHLNRAPSFFAANSCTTAVLSYEAETIIQSKGISKPCNRHAS